MDLVVKIIFYAMFVASFGFYTFFTIKKMPDKRKWLELALWTMILVIEFTGYKLGIWSYTLGITAFVVVVTKLIDLMKKKK